MNHCLFSLMCCCAVFTALSRSHGDEATPTKDLTVHKLANRLYRPGYGAFVATRDRLRMMAKEDNGQYSAEAARALKSFAERADRWLIKVGNTNDWQSFNDAETDVGEGRVRGNKSGAQVPMSVWIKLEKKTPLRDMAYLYSYGPLSNAYIQGEYVTDEHLAYLSGFKDLTLLDIHNASVNGAFLSQVRIPSLRFLHISNSPVGDEAIPAEVLDGLSTVDFMGTMITNETVKRISRKNIRCLNVMNTAVNEDGLMRLTDAENLQAIYLDLYDLTPEVITMLSNKDSLLRVHIGYYKPDVERAEAMAHRFPPGVGVIKAEIPEVEDYRKRWRRTPAKQ